MEVLKLIAESNPSAQLLNGFDEALVGVGRQGLSDPVAVYDYALLAAVLVCGGMTQLEAEEYIQHNIEASCLGPHSPIIARLMVSTDPDSRSSVAKTS